MLQNKYYHKFEINDEDLHFLNCMLELDVGFDLKNIFNDGMEIDVADSYQVAEKIEDYLGMNLFEYRLNDNKCVPVLDVQTSALSDDFKINPLSNEKRYFLTSLIEFLNRGLDIEIV